MSDGTLQSDGQFAETLLRMSEELFRSGHRQASMHALASAFHIAEERRDMKALETIAAIADSRAAAPGTAAPARDGKSNKADFAHLARTVREAAWNLRSGHPE